MLLVLELEALADLAEHLAQQLDLVVWVRRGDLDTEARLILRDQGVGRHRHVDAAVEQVAADDVDVVVVRQGDLDEREPGLVGCVDVELVQPLYVRAPDAVEPRP